MNGLLKRKDKKAGIPKRNPTPRAQPAPPPPPPAIPLSKKIVVQFRPKITGSHPVQKRANRIVFGAGTLIVLFLGAGCGTRFL